MRICVFGCGEFGGFGKSVGGGEEGCCDICGEYVRRRRGVGIERVVCLLGVRGGV